MNKKFKLYLSDPYLNKGDIFITEGHITKGIVTSTPKSRWWLKILEYVTFGWYSAPIYYTCKILKDD